MSDRPVISGRWGGRTASLVVVEPRHDDEAMEPALVRAARLLEAQVALMASIEREATLVRAVIDVRLARIEALLLKGHEVERTPTGVTAEGREIVQMVRTRRVETTRCAVCEAPFTRRHPRKTRCDSCTRTLTRAKERARYRAHRKEEP